MTLHYPAIFLFSVLEATSYDRNIDEYFYDYALFSTLDQLMNR